MNGAATSAQATYHIVQRILVGGDGGWDYLEADPIGRRLYVTHRDHVVVIDMDKLTAWFSMPTPASPSPAFPLVKGTTQPSSIPD